MEAKWFVLNNARIQFKTRSLQTLAATRVATIKDGHIILLGHCIDGIEQGEEVFLRVDVLLTMGRKKDILSLLQAVDTAVEMNKSGDHGIPVPNYVDENVSTKVVKIIQSYTGVVNKMVWRKF